MKRLTHFCPYCGALTTGRACSAHSDLPALDPKTARVVASATVSTATPTAIDYEIASPIIEAHEAGDIDRGGYWHAIQPALLSAHPEFSGHDATRVARIMAPFPLRDDRYAPR